MVRIEFGAIKPRPLPFGYVCVRLYNRDAIAVMPLWLSPFYRLQREWQRLVFEPLMAVGIWVVADGDYYVNGKWAFHQPFKR